MARRKAHVPLAVFLNSQRVGRLDKEPSGAIAFTYHPDWLARDHALPVSLSLPLREERYAGAPVVAVFDNLLPDAAQIRARAFHRDLRPRSWKRSRTPPPRHSKRSLKKCPRPSRNSSTLLYAAPPRHGFDYSKGACRDERPVTFVHSANGTEIFQ